MMRADFLSLQKGDVMAVARECFSGNLVGNMGYTFEEAELAISKGAMDAVAFGNFFISNPDLVERIINNFPLATADQSTYYSPGAKGYTDYPEYTP